MADTFDRLLGSLHGLPEVLATKPTTVRVVSAFLGEAQTFIVQTYRQKNKNGVTEDTVFLEITTATQHVRIVLPARAVDVIVRQREALTARARSRHAKARAQADKAAGVVPGFLRAKRGDAA